MNVLLSSTLRVGAGLCPGSNKWNEKAIHRQKSAEPEEGESAHKKTMQMVER